MYTTVRIFSSLSMVLTGKNDDYKAYYHPLYLEKTGDKTAIFSAAGGIARHISTH